jgi:cysteinyl-tRNA synthetase
MIAYIQILVEKGFAYVEKDGSVYFDISKFPNYGKLSGLEKRELKSGTRVLSDEYTKDDVQDFALWKAVDEGEVGYDSPWGKGRPGWHIECSVMSQSILGNKIDIHTGGIDLVFPHHENEIAQSEAKTGDSPFVKYWVHGAHMLVDGKKMSKSLHNFYTLAEIVDRGFDPLALRYLFLQTHYRQEMNFTLEALEAAQNALNKIWDKATVFGHNINLENDREPSEEIKNVIDKFKEAINDDLNMPKALGLFHEGLNISHDDHDVVYLMTAVDQIFGLDMEKMGREMLKKENKEVPDKVQKMLDERGKLRNEKKFDEADKIREKILEMGYKVEDKS